jgi:hypothetical protein
MIEISWPLYLFICAQCLFAGFTIGVGLERQKFKKVLKGTIEDLEAHFERQKFKKVLKGNDDEDETI